MSETVNLRTRLPRLDPVEIQARNRLLGALSGLQVDDGGCALDLKAEVWPGEPEGVFLRLRTERGWVALAPHTIDRRPAFWVDRPESVILPECVAALGRLEPIIAALEVAAGLAMEPIHIGPASGLAVDLEAADLHGVCVHRLRLVFDRDIAQAWPAPVFDPAQLGAAWGLSMACNLVIEGPRPPRHELAALSVGDLALLPASLGGGWSARLAGRRGRLNGPPFRFTVTSQESHNMLDHDAHFAEPPSADAVSAAAPGGILGDLPVRLRVALNEVKLPIQTIAALRPGSVLTLPIVGDSVAVEVLADDLPIAEGRLVAVGDAYGVLIDRLREGRGL